jgi:hypothetical protein
LILEWQFGFASCQHRGAATGGGNEAGEHHEGQSAGNLVGHLASSLRALDWRLVHAANFVQFPHSLIGDRQFFPAETENFSRHAHFFEILPAENRTLQCKLALPACCSQLFSELGKPGLRQV